MKLTVGKHDPILAVCLSLPNDFSILAALGACAVVFAYATSAVVCGLLYSFCLARLFLYSLGKVPALVSAGLR